MARLRFPGRPGYRFDRIGVRYGADEARQTTDPSLAVVAGIHKGLQRFKDLFGDSDEDEEFQGFTIEDVHSAERHLQRCQQAEKDYLARQAEQEERHRLARSQAALASFTAAAASASSSTAVPGKQRFGAATFKQILKTGLVQEAKPKSGKGRKALLSGLTPAGDAGYSENSIPPVRERVPSLKHVKLKRLTHTTAGSEGAVFRKPVGRPRKCSQDSGLEYLGAESKSSKYRSAAQHLLAKATKLHQSSPGSFLASHQQKRKFVLPTKSSRSSRVIKPNKRFLEADDCAIRSALLASAVAVAGDGQVAYDEMGQIIGSPGVGIEGNENSISPDLSLLSPTTLSSSMGDTATKTSLFGIDIGEEKKHSSPFSLHHSPLASLSPFSLNREKGFPAFSAAPQPSGTTSFTDGAVGGAVAKQVGQLDQPLIVEGKRPRKPSLIMRMKLVEDDPLDEVRLQQSMNMESNVASPPSAYSGQQRRPSETSDSQDNPSTSVPTLGYGSSKSLIAPAKLFSDSSPRLSKKHRQKLKVALPVQQTVVLRQAKLQLNRAALNRSKAALARSLKAKMKRESKLERKLRNSQRRLRKSKSESEGVEPSDVPTSVDGVSAVGAVSSLPALDIPCADPSNLSQLSPFSQQAAKEMVEKSKKGLFQSLDGSKSLEDETPVTPTDDGMDFSFESIAADEEVSTDTTPSKRMKRKPGPKPLLVGEKRVVKAVPIFGQPGDSDHSYEYFMSIIHDKDILKDYHVGTQWDCLVCGISCLIKANRKLPVLPLCRACKKAYFFQLSKGEHQGPRSRVCPSKPISGRCGIGQPNYVPGTLNCAPCKYRRFCAVLRVAKNLGLTAPLWEMGHRATYRPQPTVKWKKYLDKNRSSGEEMSDGDCEYTPTPRKKRHKSGDDLSGLDVGKVSHRARRRSLSGGNVTADPSDLIQSKNLDQPLSVDVGDTSGSFTLSPPQTVSSTKSSPGKSGRGSAKKQSSDESSSVRTSKGGPRIKHVCRRAAIVFPGQRATFPGVASTGGKGLSASGATVVASGGGGSGGATLTLSALPNAEKEQVLARTKLKREFEKYTSSDSSGDEKPRQRFYSTPSSERKSNPNQRVKKERRLSLSCSPVKENAMEMKDEENEHNRKRESKAHSDSGLAEDEGNQRVVSKSPNKKLLKRQRRPYFTQRERRLRCGKCKGCATPDCGHCSTCKDKPKFGGKGLMRKPCIHSVCCNLRRVRRATDAFIDPKSPDKYRRSDNGDDDSGGDYKPPSSFRYGNNGQSQSSRFSKRRTSNGDHNGINGDGSGVQDANEDVATDSGDNGSVNTAVDDDNDDENNKGNAKKPAATPAITQCRTGLDMDGPQMALTYQRRRAQGRFGPAPGMTATVQLALADPNSHRYLARRVAAVEGMIAGKMRGKKKKSAITEMKPVETETAYSGSVTLKTHLIKADFQDDYDVETAWSHGFALTVTGPSCVRSLCFLCGSAGKHQMIYCIVCCQSFHNFCLEEGERPEEVLDTGQQSDLETDQALVPVSGHDDEEGQHQNGTASRQIGNISSAALSWCCRRCQFCHVCGQQNGLLKCHRCRDTYHPECLGPNYPTKPSRKNIWVCTKCVRCKSCGATTPGVGTNATWTYDFSLCHECGKLMDKGNFCPICHKCYSDDDWESKMIQCSSCESWVHAKCEELTDEMYQLLANLPEDIHYRCWVCEAREDNKDASQAPISRCSYWQKVLQTELLRGLFAVMAAVLASKCAQVLQDSGPPKNRSKTKAMEEAKNLTVLESVSQLPQIVTVNLDSEAACGTQLAPGLPRTASTTLSLSPELLPSSSSPSKLGNTPRVSAPQEDLSQTNDDEQKVFNDFKEACEMSGLSCGDEGIKFGPCKSDGESGVGVNSQTLSPVCDEVKNDPDAIKCENLTGVKVAPADVVICLDSDDESVEEEKCKGKDSAASALSLLSALEPTSKPGDLKSVIDLDLKDSQLVPSSLPSTTPSLQTTLIDLASDPARISPQHSLPKSADQSQFLDVFKNYVSAVTAQPQSEPSASTLDKVADPLSSVPSICLKPSPSMSSVTRTLFQDEKDHDQIQDSVLDHGVSQSNINSDSQSTENVSNTLPFQTEKVSSCNLLDAPTTSGSNTNRIKPIDTNTELPTASTDKTHADPNQMHQTMCISDVSTDTAPSISPTSVSEMSSLTVQRTPQKEAAGAVVTFGSLPKVRGEDDKKEKNHPKDFFTVQNKIEDGRYSSLEEFSEDVVRIIQALLFENQNFPTRRKQARSVRSIFIKQMERTFPWFNVNTCKLWEHNRGLPEGMLRDAVLPPSQDHTYAQWLERQVVPMHPQPSPFKRVGTPQRRTSEDAHSDGKDMDVSDSLLSPVLPQDFEDTRICLLCAQRGDDLPDNAGRLLYCGQDDWVHINCALWSAEVFEEVDGSLQNVMEATNRGKKLRCDLCQRVGATVGCCAANCSANYHFMCARQDKCVFQVDRVTFCRKHAGCQDCELIQPGHFAILRRVCVDLNKIRSKSPWGKAVDPSVLSVLIGSCIVESLGMLKSYLSDTEQCLLPVDFCCTRIYWSTQDARRRCVYTCRIIEVKPEAVNIGEAQIKDMRVVHDTTHPDYVPLDTLNLENCGVPNLSMMLKSPPVQDIDILPPNSSATISEIEDEDIMYVGTSRTDDCRSVSGSSSNPTNALPAKQPTQKTIDLSCLSPSTLALLNIKDPKKYLPPARSKSQPVSSSVGKQIQGPSGDGELGLLKIAERLNCAASREKSILLPRKRRSSSSSPSPVTVPSIPRSFTPIPTQLGCWNSGKATPIGGGISSHNPSYDEYLKQKQRYFESRSAAHSLSPPPLTAKPPHSLLRPRSLSEETQSPGSSLSLLPPKSAVAPPPKKVILVMPNVKVAEKSIKLASSLRSVISPVPESPARTGRMYRSRSESPFNIISTLERGDKIHDFRSSSVSPQPVTKSSGFSLMARPENVSAFASTKVEDPKTSSTATLPKGQSQAMAKIEESNIQSVARTQSQEDNSTAEEVLSDESVKSLLESVPPEVLEGDENVQLVVLPADSTEGLSEDEVVRLAQSVVGDSPDEGDGSGGEHASNEEKRECEESEGTHDGGSSKSCDGIHGCEEEGTEEMGRTKTCDGVHGCGEEETGENAAGSSKTCDGIHGCGEEKTRENNEAGSSETCDGIHGCGEEETGEKEVVSSKLCDGVHGCGKENGANLSNESKFVIRPFGADKLEEKTGDENSKTCDGIHGCGENENGENIDAERPNACSGNQGCEEDTSGENNERSRVTQKCDGVHGCGEDKVEGESKGERQSACDDGCNDDGNGEGCKKDKDNTQGNSSCSNTTQSPPKTSTSGSEVTSGGSNQNDGGGDDRQPGDEGHGGRAKKDADVCFDEESREEGAEDTEQEDQEEERSGPEETIDLSQESDDEGKCGDEVDGKVSAQVKIVTKEATEKGGETREMKEHLEETNQEKQSVEGEEEGEDNAMEEPRGNQRNEPGTDASFHRSNLSSVTVGEESQSEDNSSAEEENGELEMIDLSESEITWPVGDVGGDSSGVAADNVSPAQEDDKNGKTTTEETSLEVERKCSSKQFGSDVVDAAVFASTSSQVVSLGSEVEDVNIVKSDCDYNSLANSEVSNKNEQESTSKHSISSPNDAMDIPPTCLQNSKAQGDTEVEKINVCEVNESGNREKMKKKLKCKVFINKQESTEDESDYLLLDDLSYSETTTNNDEDSNIEGDGTDKVDDGVTNNQGSEQSSDSKQEGRETKKSSMDDKLCDDVSVETASAEVCERDNSESSQAKTSGLSIESIDDTENQVLHPIHSIGASLSGCENQEKLENESPINVKASVSVYKDSENVTNLPAREPNSSSEAQIVVDDAAKLIMKKEENISDGILESAPKENGSCERSEAQDNNNLNPLDKFLTDPTCVEDEISSKAGGDEMDDNAGSGEMKPARVDVKKLSKSELLQYDTKSDLGDAGCLSSSECSVQQESCEGAKEGSMDANPCADESNKDCNIDTMASRSCGLSKGLIDEDDDKVGVMQTLESDKSRTNEKETDLPEINQSKETPAVVEKDNIPNERKEVCNAELPNQMVSSESILQDQTKHAEGNVEIVLKDDFTKPASENQRDNGNNKDVDFAKSAVSCSELNTGKSCVETTKLSSQTHEEDSPQKCPVCKRIYRTQVSFDIHVKNCNFEVSSDEEEEEKVIERDGDGGQKTLRSSARLKPIRKEAEKGLEELTKPEETLEEKELKEAPEGKKIMSESESEKETFAKMRFEKKPSASPLSEPLSIIIGEDACDGGGVSTDDCSSQDSRRSSLRRSTVSQRNAAPAHLAKLRSRDSSAISSPEPSSPASLLSPRGRRRLSSASVPEKFSPKETMLEAVGLVSRRTLELSPGSDVNANIEPGSSGGEHTCAVRLQPRISPVTMAVVPKREKRSCAATSPSQAGADKGAKLSIMSGVRSTPSTSAVKQEDTCSTTKVKSIAITSNPIVVDEVMIGPIKKPRKKRVWWVEQSESSGEEEEEEDPLAGIGLNDEDDGDGGVARRTRHGRQRLSQEGGEHKKVSVKKDKADDETEIDNNCAEKLTSPSSCPLSKMPEKLQEDEAIAEKSGRGRAGLRRRSEATTDDVDSSCPSTPKLSSSKEDQVGSSEVERTRAGLRRKSEGKNDGDSSCPSTPRLSSSKEDQVGSEVEKTQSESSSDNDGEQEDSMTDNSQQDKSPIRRSHRPSNKSAKLSEYLSRLKREKDIQGKKSISEDQVPESPKRGRGRPRIYPINEKRPGETRGRPRTYPINEKRPGETRGRPRIHPIVEKWPGETKASPKISSIVEKPSPGEKRGRGRPRIYPREEKAVAKVESEEFVQGEETKENLSSTQSPAEDMEIIRDTDIPEDVKGGERTSDKLKSQGTLPRQLRSRSRENLKNASAQEEEELWGDENDGGAETDEKNVHVRAEMISKSPKENVSTMKKEMEEVLDKQGTENSEETLSEQGHETKMEDSMEKTKPSAREDKITASGSNSSSNSSAHNKVVEAIKSGGGQRLRIIVRSPSAFAAQKIGELIKKTAQTVKPDAEDVSLTTECKGEETSDSATGGKINTRSNLEPTRATTNPEVGEKSKLPGSGRSGSSSSKDVKQDGSTTIGGSRSVTPESVSAAYDIQSDDFSSETSNDVEDFNTKPTVPEEAKFGAKDRPLVRSSAITSAGVTASEPNVTKTPGKVSVLPGLPRTSLPPAPGVKGKSNPVIVCDEDDDDDDVVLVKAVGLQPPEPSIAAQPRQPMSSPFLITALPHYQPSILSSQPKASLANRVHQSTNLQHMSGGSVSTLDINSLPKIHEIVGPMGQPGRVIPQSPIAQKQQPSPVRLSPPQVGLPHASNSNSNLLLRFTSPPSSSPSQTFIFPQGSLANVLPSPSAANLSSAGSILIPSTSLAGGLAFNSQTGGLSLQTLQAASQSGLTLHQPNQPGLPLQQHQAISPNAIAFPAGGNSNQPGVSLSTTGLVGQASPGGSSVVLGPAAAQSLGQPQPLSIISLGHPNPVQTALISPLQALQQQLQQQQQHALPPHASPAILPTLTHSLNPLLSQQTSPPSAQPLLIGQPVALAQQPRLILPQQQHLPQQQIHQQQCVQQHHHQQQPQQHQQQQQNRQVALAHQQTQQMSTNQPQQMSTPHQASPLVKLPPSSPLPHSKLQASHASHSTIPQSPRLTSPPSQTQLTPVPLTSAPRLTHVDGSPAQVNYMGTFDLNSSTLSSVMSGQNITRDTTHMIKDLVQRALKSGGREVIPGVEVKSAITDTPQGPKKVLRVFINEDILPLSRGAVDESNAVASQQAPSVLSSTASPSITSTSLLHLQQQARTSPATNIAAMAAASLQPLRRNLPQTPPIQQHQDQAPPSQQQQPPSTPDWTKLLPGQVDGLAESEKFSQPHQSKSQKPQSHKTNPHLRKALKARLPTSLSSIHTNPESTTDIMGNKRKCQSDSADGKDDIPSTAKKYRAVIEQTKDGSFTGSFRDASNKPELTSKSDGSPVCLISVTTAISTALTTITTSTFSSSSNTANSKPVLKQLLDAGRVGVNNNVPTILTPQSQQEQKAKQPAVQQPIAQLSSAALSEELKKLEKHILETREKAKMRDHPMEQQQAASSLQRASFPSSMTPQQKHLAKKERIRKQILKRAMLKKDHFVPGTEVPAKPKKTAASKTKKMKTVGTHHPLIHHKKRREFLPQPTLEEEVVTSFDQLSKGDHPGGGGRGDNSTGSSAEAGRSRLKFEITSDDGFSCQGETMEDAWGQVLEKVQDVRAACRMKQLSYTGVSGRSMAGLDNNSVVYLLEQLYGAVHCHTNYRFRYHKYDLDQADAEIKENQSGSARAEAFSTRKPFDMFNFLKSVYRVRPGDEEREKEEEMVLKSSRRATSLSLPMAMRFRKLKTFAKEAVDVYRSKIHGRGLFCKRNIDAGEMIIEYAGEVIRASLTDKREKYYESKGIGCYMFRIDDDEVVDATMHGSAARFINHSCEPNCFSKVILVEGKKHIVIFAMRPIKRGEELTYDYKFPIEEVKIPCHCGSKRCRKYLN